MLAFACAFTMFAGAAFTDQADINADNAEAVDLLTALGVIDGYEDGSFNPEGVVTRAEMAKMIYTIRNGGNDDASAYETVTTSFTDINGHWAEGYVKYLQNTGIVSGKTATQFDPDSQVTTGEAMKMALALAGYDEEHAGLTGTAWLNNTVSLATTNGLTDDVNSSISGGCTRQDAAQILANTIDMTAVRYSSVVEDFVNDSENGLSWGGDPITVGQKWLNLDPDDEGILTSVTKEEGRDTYAITVDGDGMPSGGFIRVAVDYSDLLGQKVKVLYEEGTRDSVYGVYATDDNTVVTALVDDLDDLGQNRFTVDGTSYRAEGTDNGEDIDVYYTPTFDIGTADTTLGALAYETISDAANEDYRPYYTVTLIDNDGNGRIDLAITTPVVAAQLDYLTTTRATVTTIETAVVASTSTTFNLENDDVTLYDGAEEDDYVLVVDADYTVSGDTEITAMEVVSGTVEARRTSSNEFRIDGTWYTLMSADDNLPSVGDEVDAAVIGTFAFALDASSSSVSADNILFVDNAARIESGLNNGDYEAKVYFADGTNATVRLTKLDDEDISDEISNANELIGNLYTFDADGDEYELETLERGSYDSLIYADTAEIDDGTADLTDTVINDNAVGNSTLYFSDEAIVFVRTNDDTAVVTGARVNSWSNVTDAEQITALANTSNGANYTRIGAINLTAGDRTTVPGGGAYSYGYVLENPSEVDDMDELVLFDGEGEITVVTDESTTGIHKGDFIQYNIVSDNEIEDIEVQSIDDAVAITSFTSSRISFNNRAAIDFADDYVIIGVDSEDVEGVPTSTLRTARNNVPNAVYFVNDDGDVEAVFIDVNNEMAEATAADNTVSLTAPDAVTYGDASVSIGATIGTDLDTDESPVVNIYTTRTGYTVAENISGSYASNTITVNTSSADVGTYYVALTYDGVTSDRVAVVVEQLEPELAIVTASTSGTTITLSGATGIADSDLEGITVTATGTVSLSADTPLTVQSVSVSGDNITITIAETLDSVSPVTVTFTGASANVVFPTTPVSGTANT